MLSLYVCVYATRYIYASAQTEGEGWRNEHRTKGIKTLSLSLSLSLYLNSIMQSVQFILSLYYPLASLSLFLSFFLSFFVNCPLSHSLLGVFFCAMRWMDQLRLCRWVEAKVDSGGQEVEKRDDKTNREELQRQINDFERRLLPTFCRHCCCCCCTLCLLLHSCCIVAGWEREREIEMKVDDDDEDIG